MSDDARTVTPPPPPSWLDPAAEVARDETHPTPAQFVARVAGQLRARGLSWPQCFTVAAHLALETGRGKKSRGNNLGGWKINRAFARAYKRRTGRSAPWWGDRGHTKSGDAPWVYYRAFDSDDAFIDAFLAAFAPRPAPGAPSLEGEDVEVADYRLAGERFHNGGDWFAALLAACYRGKVTRANPGPSIARHRDLEREMRARFAQLRLGVVCDGAWGPKSRAACERFQRAHGLPVTGEPDDATCTALEAGA